MNPDERKRSEQGKRLQAARLAAGFKSGRAAAQNFEWPESTYRSHEAGTRTIGQDDAEKYARALKTSAQAILFGEEAPRLLLIEPAGRETVIGSALREGRKARGASIRQIAEAVGVDASAISGWEGGSLIPTGDELERAAAFLRLELPALARGEITAADDEPLGNAAFISDAMPPYFGTRDVERLGVVAAGDDGDFEFNGQVAEYVSRPRGLVGRPGVFALEIISESMYPAYRKSDIVFCDRREPEVGDDVVIETFPENGSASGMAYVKRLKLRSASKIVVEQFNPPQDLTFDPYSIKHVWRVVPNRELHGY